MKNFIKITYTSLRPFFHRDSEVQFRSLEKYLEKLSRDYNVDDDTETITVLVQNKDDAIVLANKLELANVTYSEGGVLSEIKVKAPKKSGRPKNTVRVSGVEKGMTAKQFCAYSIKELQKTHVTKSQIIQAKILTKTQLDKYITDGTLSTVNITDKIFLDREAVFKLMKK